MPTVLQGEALIEAAAVEWFQELGYVYRHGTELTGEEAPERASFGDVVLEGRLRAAVLRLNPLIPEEARDEAVRKVLRLGSPSLAMSNREFHRMLRDGVPVEYARSDGTLAGDHVRLVDFSEIDQNDWLVVNQFTVIENGHQRRPDVVVFLNSLPLAILELKDAAAEDATIWTAHASSKTCWISTSWSVPVVQFLPTLRALSRRKLA